VGYDFILHFKSYLIQIYFTVLSFLIFCAVSCDSFNTRSTCISNNAGVLCAWADDQRCMSVSEAKLLLKFKNIENTEVHSCQTVPDGKFRLKVYIY